MQHLPLKQLLGGKYASSATYRIYWLFIRLFVNYLPFSFFEKRTKFRKEANHADNEAATVAVDSLINYEAVKYFNNEKFEVDQYDKALSKYELASLKIATSLSLLNSGQNIIFSSALTLMMYLAAQGITTGK